MPNPYLSSEAVMSNPCVRVVSGMWGFTHRQLPKGAGYLLERVKDSSRIQILDSLNYRLQIESNPPMLIRFEGHDARSPLPSRMYFNDEDATFLLNDTRQALDEARMAVLHSVRKRQYGGGDDENEDADVQVATDSLSKLILWKDTLSDQPTNSELVAGLELLSEADAALVLEMRTLRGKDLFDKYAEQLQDPSSGAAMFLYMITLSSMQARRQAVLEEVKDESDQNTATIKPIQKLADEGTSVSKKTNRSLRWTDLKQRAFLKYQKWGGYLNIILTLSTLTTNQWTHMQV